MNMIGVLLGLLVSANGGLCSLPHSFICPASILIGWRNFPPYIYLDKQNNMTGTLLALLRGSVNACCRNHTTFVFEEIANSTMLIEKSVTSDFDIVLPIVAQPYKKRFIAFPFVSFLESPGAVFFNFGRISSSQVIVKTLRRIGPILLPMMLMVCIVGVLYWIVNIIPSQDGKERSVSKMFGEIMDGFWWAFITSTTVGYGDFLPKRLPGRVLCLIWLICSGVFVAVFTATVTSILIESCFNANLRIVGTKLAVIDGSKEHQLVVQSGGFAAAYRNFDEFLLQIDNDNDVLGGLFDLYSASYYQKAFHHFRIQTLVEKVYGYGVVLRTRLVMTKHCFRQYIFDQHSAIYTAMREDFPPLKSIIESSVSEDASQQLLEPSTKFLRQGLVSMTCIILVLCLLGICREKIFLNKPKKGYTKPHDSMDNFILLHSIKSSHQKSLKENMHELENDLQKLQSGLERVGESLSSKLAITDNLFRANIPIPYERQHDIDGE